MAQKQPNSKQKTTRKRGPLTEAAKLRRRQRMQAKRDAEPATEEATEQTEVAPVHVAQGDPLIQHSLPSATFVAARDITTNLRTVRNPNGFPPFITGVNVLGVVVKSRAMPLSEAMEVEKRLLSQYRSRGTREIPDY